MWLSRRVRCGGPDAGALTALALTAGAGLHRSVRTCPRPAPRSPSRAPRDDEQSGDMLLALNGDSRYRQQLARLADGDYTLTSLTVRASAYARSGAGRRYRGCSRHGEPIGNFLQPVVGPGGQDALAANVRYWSPPPPFDKLRSLTPPGRVGPGSRRVDGLEARATSAAPDQPRLLLDQPAPRLECGLARRRQLGQLTAPDDQRLHPVKVHEYDQQAGDGEANEGALAKGQRGHLSVVPSWREAGTAPYPDPWSRVR